MTPHVLTLAQTAELLRLNSETVRQGVLRGVITLIAPGQPDIDTSSLCRLLAVSSLQNIVVITPEEVSELFKVHPRIPQQWARNGRLPGIKWGQTTLRFVRSHIETAMLQQNPHATPQQIRDFLDKNQPYYTLKEMKHILGMSGERIRRRTNTLLWYLYLPGGTERRYTFAPSCRPTVVEWQRIIAVGAL